MKNIFLKNELENELTEVQNSLVEKSFGKILSILDVGKAIGWSTKNKVNSIIVFGSRTRLHEKEDSDLDILITDCDALDDFNDDNYLEGQKKLVDDLYQSFVNEVVKEESIELDFKLNVNRFDSEGYNGLTANAVGTLEDNDFYLESQDIPSYFE